MADTKISALPQVTTPAATDEFAVNQAGTSKKVTLSQVMGSGVVVGYPKVPTSSLTVPDGWAWDVDNRLTLAGGTRATFTGNADVILMDDFRIRSRIVLSGRG